MKTFLRWLSILPAILMLLLIFNFSAQDGPSSGSLSFRVCCMILSFVDRIFSLDLSSPVFLSHAETMQFYVRKAAHITEYFFLTLSFFLPLRVLLPWKERNTTLKRFLLVYLLPAFWLSILAACADEFHQSFVPGRCGTPKDVLVDSIGMLLACLLLVLCRYFNHKKKRNQIGDSV